VYGTSLREQLARTSPRTSCSVLSCAEANKKTTDNVT